MCKSTREICSILPATQVLSKGPSYKKLETLSLSESRFKEVLRLGIDNSYNFTYRLGSFMFSPHYSYACYLVFKFEENHVPSDDYYVLKAEYNLGDTTQGTVFVRSNPTPNNIPTIEPKKDIGLRDSSKSIRMPKGCWVRERNDGWTEFSLIEPLPQLENHESLEVKLLRPKFGSLEGIIVEGIEFRPVVRDGSYLDETSTKDDLIGTHLQAINDMQEDEEVEGLKSLPIRDEDDKDDDEYWEKKLPDEYPRYIVMSDKLYDYTTKKELYLSLCQGFSGCNGKLWFSVRKSTRGICSILPATQVLSKGPSYKKLETLSLSESRFKEVLRLGTDNWYNFTYRLGSFMFSPHYSYACYLVFKFEDNHVLSDDILVLKAEYNLGDTTQGTVFVYLNPKPNNIPTTEPKKDIELRDYSSKSIQMPKGSSWVRERNDGWTEFSLIEPLPQLENHESLEVKLLRRKFGSLEGIILEGIEFRPVFRDGSYQAETSTKDNLIGTRLQMQEDEEVEGLKSLSITDEEDIDDDEYWEKKLPDEYPRYIVMSDKPYYYSSIQELYLSLCQGFFGCNGKLWFSMCKSTRGICSILAATHVLSKGPSYKKLETLSLSESRFKEVLRLGTDNWYNFTCRLGSFMFSPHYSYACYLVFKFEDNHVLSDDILVLKAEYNLGNSTQGTVFVYLNPKPNNIPTTEPKKDTELRDSSKSIQMPKGCSWVRERNDGWTEFSLIEPLPQLENHELLEVKLLRPKFGSLEGIIVEGIEFRPVVREGSYLDETSTKGNLIGTQLLAINDMQEDAEAEIGFRSLSITDEEDIDDDDEYWETKLPDEYPCYIVMSDKPHYYTTKKELYLSLCQGFSGCDGKLWFSMCKLSRGICSFLPATKVISNGPSYEKLETLSLSESRFKEVLRLGTDNCYKFTCRLGSFMFSPHYSYACYLVFKFEDNHVLSDDILVIKAEYNLGDTTQGTVLVRLNPTPNSIPTIEPKKDIGLRVSSKSIRMPKGCSWVRERNDGWTEFSLIKPLPHLENHKSLEVKLLRPKFGSLEGIIVEGIDFRPVVRDGSYLAETSTKHNLIGTHLLAINDHEENKDDDEYWEKKLPDDYQRHIEMSDEPLEFSTKKELYLLFCHGFLANNDNGQLWFSTCKLTRGICSILPATHVLFMDSRYDKLKSLSLSESRFKEVRKLGTDPYYYLRCRLESFMFSPDHYTYACYLVFQFEDDHVLSNDGPIFTAYLNDCRIEVFAKLDLTSVITKRVRKSWVEKRNDGWMEARLTKPLLKHHLENREKLRVELHKIEGGSLDGIIVEGVEFRPEVVDGSYLVVETSIKDNLIGTNLQHEEDKDDDEYWEKKLPDDYQRHIEMSDEPLDYITKKELYLLFCHGFLANNDNGPLWFSTCKLTRGLCTILPATHVLSKSSSYKYLETLSLSESRFKEVIKLGYYGCYELTCRLESFMFSRDHDTYACYLVFKFQDDYVLSNYGRIFTTELDVNYIDVFANLDLTSVITKRVRKSWVEKRNDGWMEARLTTPLLKHQLENREELKIKLYDFRGGKFDRAIVEGIEFRPVVVG